MKSKISQDLDDYIRSFPPTTQLLLTQIRKLIAASAPKATECIKYAMPTYEYFDNLVHFAAYKNHLGFYPAPSGLKAFQQEIDAYPNSKGAVKIYLDRPLPIALITKIVKFRVNENEAKATLKRTKKTCPQGHHYLKSTDCRSCLECNATLKISDVFMHGLSAPAQRALLVKNIFLWKFYLLIAKKIYLHCMV